MSHAPDRYRLAVDVHLLLVRYGPDGGTELLLSRRAGAVYATGLWHAPSGHLDGPHEDVVTAVIREAAEETGVRIEPEAVRLAATVHHRGPLGRARIGLFFEALAWEGIPHVREPEVCDAMGWYPLDALPEPMTAYCRAALDAYRAGLPGAVHFQEPGDPVPHHTDAPDRTRQLPGPARAPRTP